MFPWGLTPELSRPAKRVRLERIVRPRFAVLSHGLVLSALLTFPTLRLLVPNLPGKGGNVWIVRMRDLLAGVASYQLRDGFMDASAHFPSGITRRAEEVVAGPNA